MRKPVAIIGSVIWFVVAPILVAGLVPWWLTGWQLGRTWLPLQILGGLLAAAGAAVVVEAFVRFVTEGHGTPAPVAPPKRLVVGGFYRFVRNPMYVAVILVIIGQALVLGRLGLWVYAGAVWLVSVGFVRLIEEPALRAQFGAGYEEYRHAVPAWVPRPKPWRPGH